MRAVRFVDDGGSKSTNYRRALRSSDIIVIDSLSSGPNVAVRFKCDGKPLETRFPPEARDLVDLAIIVYILDELERRGAAPDGWSRTFDIVFPVCEPRRWVKAEQHLRNTLYRLSGDDFAFEWCSLSALPPIPKHRTRLPRGFDAVCLFSGGLDSLLGATRLLEEGRKVILVGHHADGTTAAAQKEMAAAVRARYPKNVSLIQCGAAQSRRVYPNHRLPEKCEETHRTRSFLFLALAVAIARATSINEIFIAENGLIALNPPLQPSRLGTATTRTAHPRFLLQMADFLRRSGIFNGLIKNPFLYQSKTDLLRDIEPWIFPLIQRSVSCARPSRYQNKGVRHCGYCVPCIYRRAALLEAGLDRASDYAFDVFRNLPTLSAQARVDFRALVRFARRVLAGTSADVEQLVVSNGSFAPEVAGRLGPFAANDYKPWSDMLRRWAEDFTVKVDKQCSASTKRILSLTGSNQEKN